MLGVWRPRLWFLSSRPRALARKRAGAAKAPPEGQAAALAPSPLDNIMRQIEQTFGEGTVMKLDAETTQWSAREVVSTGSLSLDLALGIGGLPRGRITEIFGPEASGKTTLALHCLATAQRAGGQCVFVDAEHALDVRWARKLGVRTDQLLVAQPDSGEQAMEIIDTLVQTNQVDVIVLDSVAALVTRAELEGDMGALQIGAQARLMSQAMRKLVGALKKSNTLLIFLNQLRLKIGIMFGNPETTSGGNALKYYASVRLDIRRIGSLKAGDAVIANQVRVKVAKNKLAAPYRQAEFDIDFEQGISKLGEIVDLGIKFDILEKTGSWYTWRGSGQLGQGREKVKQYLRDHPQIAADIEAEIRDAAFGTSAGSPEATGPVANEPEPSIEAVPEAMEQTVVDPG